MLHQEVKKYLLSLPTDEITDIVFRAYECTFELEYIMAYPNDSETFDMLFASSRDMIRAICFGNYRYTDDYVVKNQLGNIDSYNDSSIRDLYEMFIDDITEVAIEYDLLTEDVCQDLEDKAYEQVRDSLEKEEDNNND